MSDFAAKIVTLETVEAHEDRFLGLWVLDCLVEDRRFYERLATDVERESIEPDGCSGPGGWSIKQ